MQLEDEVVAALRQLGHHLSATTSHLFRQQQGTAPAAGAAAPGDLQGIHPLVFQHVPATQIAPGILDKELYNNVGQSRLCTVPLFPDPDPEKDKCVCTIIA